MLSAVVRAWSYFVVCKVLVFASSETSTSEHDLVGLYAISAGRGTGLLIAQHPHPFIESRL